MNHTENCGRCYKNGNANVNANVNVNVCHCKNEPNPACKIEPFILNQGPHNGHTHKRIDNIPSLELALMSNEFCDAEPDSVIMLNPVLLSWCDFLTLFFNSSRNFVVNTSNVFNSCVFFSSQTYENVSKCMKYNLAEQIRSTWARKCGTSIANIPIKKSITLNKDTFLIKSLASSCSLTALSLDEALETLLNNNQIAHGCYNTEAVVQFVVSYKYYFKPLDTCVQANFLYLTKIPCFKNVTDCGGECPPYYYYYYYYYSDECRSRSHIDVSNEDDTLSYIKDANFFMDENVSILSSENDNTVANTILSNDSSRW